MSRNSIVKLVAGIIAAGALGFAAGHYTAPTAPATGNTVLTPPAAVVSVDPGTQP